MTEIVIPIARIVDDPAPDTVFELFVGVTALVLVLFVPGVVCHQSFAVDGEDGHVFGGEEGRRQSRGIGAQVRVGYCGVFGGVFGVLEEEDHVGIVGGEGGDGDVLEFGHMAGGVGVWGAELACDEVEGGG